MPRRYPQKNYVKHNNGIVVKEEHWPPNIYNKNLKIACEQGNLQIVQTSITGENINHSNAIGYSYIILASTGGHTEIVDFLIMNGANVNKKTIVGNTSIYIASENGHLETVKVLLCGGSNYYCKANNNITPIMVAYKCGHNKISKVLENWPLTMLIIVLQELVVYHLLDFSSFIEFIQYFS